MSFAGCARVKVGGILKITFVYAIGAGPTMIKCGVYFRVRDRCGAYRWGGWLCAGWLVFAVRIMGGDWVEVAPAY